jgi:hypothetical protein
MIITNGNNNNRSRSSLSEAAKRELQMQAADQIKKLYGMPAEWSNSSKPPEVHNWIN